MNVTSVLSVILLMKLIIRKVTYVLCALAKSNLLSSAALRILWMIIGALLYGLTVAPPTIVMSADAHAVIMKYKAMVARDDKLLNVLLDDSWKRDCKYRVVPWTQLADGSIRQQIFQECDDEHK